jgi:phosphatidate cytidylyltransferase
VRSLSGGVFVSIILIPLFLENTLWATGVFSAFALLGFIEYNKLFSKSGVISINWRLNTLISSFIFGFFVLGFYDYFGDVFLPACSLLFPILFLWMLAELYRKKKEPLLNLAISIFGLPFVGLPFLLAIYINKEYQTSFPPLVGMFIIIWTNDTFAFLSGKFFGKTKLIERISPNKTWEGTIGGVICALLMAISLSLIFDPLNLFFWILSTFIIVPCSIFGDLIESLFKRSLNLKDSGNIMPGHGGILDRFDAALFTLPFFFVWLIFNTYF